MRAVVLDLGNVLLFHDNALLFRKLGERGGLTGDEVKRRLEGPFWDATNRGQVDAAAMRRGIQERLGLSLPDAEFDALWSCHFTLHHEVLPIVESLVGRVRLVLLSNTNPLHAAYFVPRLPVLKRFDALVLSCEVGLAKPDAEIFEEALQRAQASAPEALFFDDLPEYVEAARQVGLKARVFTTAARFQEDLKEFKIL